MTGVVVRLVLLPGLDGTGLLFAPLVRALRKDLQPVVCAYPTHECRSYQQLVPEILRQLPVDEPFLLLGESYGGPLSLMVAAQRPAGLAGLILSASFISCPYSFVPRWATHLVFSTPFLAAPALARLRHRLERFGSAELSELVGQALGAVSPDVLAARLREVILVDVQEELRACPVPILYLQGRHDLVVPAGNLARIQAIRPDVRAVCLRAPHLVVEVATEAAARVIEEFADEVSRI